MISTWLLQLIFLSFYIFLYVSSTPFIATVPSHLVPNSTVLIEVVTFDRLLPSDELIIDATLLSASPTSASLTLIANETSGYLRLFIPDSVISGDYVLNISSREFLGSTNVHVGGRNFAILVETDKPIYKPASIVYVLIIAVDSQFRPLKDLKLVIELKGPSSFKLGRWIHQTDSYGMLNISIPLSEEPELGQWNLDILHQHDLLASHSFKVEKYVLPKFKVEILLDQENIQDIISGYVRAIYTYGESVQGKVNLEVIQKPMQPLWSGWSSINTRGRIIPQSNPTLLVSQTITLVDGIANFNFQLASTSTFDSTFGGSILVQATVVSEATNYRENGTVEIDLISSSQQVEIIPQGSVAKPGLSFDILLVATNVNTDNDSSFSVTTNFGTSSTNQIVIIAKNEKQKIFSILIPRKASSMSITVGDSGQDQEARSFSDTIYMSQDLAFSPTNSYLLLRQRTMRSSVVALHSSVIFSFEMILESPSINSLLFYSVINNGKIVISGSTKIGGDNYTKGTFKFDAIPAMSPSSKVVAWVITKRSGEIVADYIPLKVEDYLPMEVVTSFNKEQVQPGDPISLEVETKDATKKKHNSKVTLIAVDNAVYLLADAQRINLAQVTEAIKEGRLGFEEPSQRNNYQGSTTKDILSLSGITFVTNQNIPENWIPEYPVFMAAFGGGGGPEIAMAFDQPMARGNSMNSLSSQSKPLTPSVNIKVRRIFPETWIWEHIVTGGDQPDGEARIQLTAPDSITTWSLHALCMSSELGLGLSIPSSLKVFQPFFVEMNLPYEAVRGETLLLTVAAYNYCQQECSDSENEHEIFISLKLSKSFSLSRKTPAVQKTMISPNGVSTVLFAITPVELGELILQVTARSVIGTDSVERTLYIIPQGIEKEYTINRFIDLKTVRQVSLPVFPTVPLTTINGSDRIIVSVTGDMMGQAMDNLGNLVRLPTGCGEQNMLNFAPNVFVMDYLMATEAHKPELVSKCVRMMQIGYQRELTYRRKDNSFSAFGNSDPEGSMWLTAFVVKSFAQSQSFIYIDPKVIAASTTYIAKKQKIDGSFPKTGKLHHQDLFGGLSGEVAYTAYVTVALLEANQKPTAINDAIKYISTQIISNQNVYTLALVAYMLSLAQTSSLNLITDSIDLSAFINRLLTQSIVDGDGRHWSTVEPTSSQSKKKIECCYHCNVRSSEIEITAYALLAITAVADQNPSVYYSAATEVAKWLLLRRNSFGGFSSTQDTVVGLQALAAYAIAMQSRNIDAYIKITEGEDFPLAEFIVNSNNWDILQQRILTTANNSLNIYANGTGTMHIQFAVRYNVLVDPWMSSFSLHVYYTRKDSASLRLQVQICGKYITEVNVDQEGMVIYEVGLFTGYFVDTETLNAAYYRKNIFKRFEVSSRKVILYWDRLNQDNDTCAAFEIVREHQVKNLQPVSSTSYAYYSPEIQTTITVSANDIRDQDWTEKKLRELIMVSIGSGLMLVCVCCIICCCFYRYKCRKKQDTVLPELNLQN